MLGEKDRATDGIDGGLAKDDGGVRNGRDTEESEVFSGTGCHAAPRAIGGAAQFGADGHLFLSPEQENGVGMRIGVERAGAIRRWRARYCSTRPSLSGSGGGSCNGAGWGGEGAGYAANRVRPSGRTALSRNRLKRRREVIRIAVLTLAGCKVREMVDADVVHYSTGDRFILWGIYDRWIGSGKEPMLWSTEEPGARGRGTARTHLSLFVGWTFSWPAAGRSRCPEG